MFTKSQLISMNYDRQFASSPWIKIIDNNSDNSKLFKLYATNDVSISTGRISVAFSADKVLTEEDYRKYNIMK